MPQSSSTHAPTTIGQVRRSALSSRYRLYEDMMASSCAILSMSWKLRVGFAFFFIPCVLDDEDYKEARNNYYEAYTGVLPPPNDFPFIAEKKLLPDIFIVIPLLSDLHKNHD
ncbi:unnamed protein product [Fusarium graminearum]|uniref:Chromosome 2, complete genome n=2 Tax=Gibberella zeae TaxID=5518 RepID=I1S6C4_GIBZE|nr:hypothetical protein FGSG_12395 [Fusarium graminearum PH-1]EYB32908.1 hypothetical protein FG05_12395 [Fusarium graminearum]ESU09505.1 hypothetical protein FGSG_12395 [Fusarium graminearum PH-1]CAF3560814.1 unnamed protein product [Fusarium graminearum]CAG2002524.1 unnamed protein product [Fusarium graminearum]CAG2008647.1 unnamed protein product [Fusarium graminearum]|eukprot:XP_011322004.1 hypothetical protein FGSG_12395 [Fusarium graminearum PH-1]